MLWWERFYSKGLSKYYTEECNLTDSLRTGQVTDLKLGTYNTDNETLMHCWLMHASYHHRCYVAGYKLCGIESNQSMSHFVCERYKLFCNLLWNLLSDGRFQHSRISMQALTYIFSFNCAFPVPDVILLHLHSFCCFLLNINNQVHVIIIP